LDTTFQGEIDATRIWTGKRLRDTHLRSADFFHVEHYPKICFTGRAPEPTGDMHAKASIDLTIGTISSAPPRSNTTGRGETPGSIRDPLRGGIQPAKLLCQ
jgi:hypothetical protein